MSSSDLVVVARDGGVIILDLNRRDVGSAISLEIARQLHYAVLDLEPSQVTERKADLRSLAECRVTVASERPFLALCGIRRFVGKLRRRGAAL